MSAIQERDDTPSKSLVNNKLMHVHTKQLMKILGLEIVRRVKEHNVKNLSTSTPGTGHNNAIQLQNFAEHIKHNGVQEKKRKSPAVLSLKMKDIRAKMNSEICRLMK